MLDLKAFETSLKSVTNEEIFKLRSRGKYVPYIQILLKKAKLIQVGRSVKIDIKNPKEAAALAQATRVYLKKIHSDEFIAGNFRTFLFVGRRNGGPMKKEKK